MKIRQLLTIDFMGMEGKRKFTFPSKINAFCQPNGSGKTSVINAIQYGLTGKEPNGDMINKNAQTATVAILGNHAYYRQKGRTSRARFGLDNRDVTKREMEESLSKEVGMDLTRAKIISSRDLLENMDPGKLGDFLMSYMGENLNRDTIKRTIPQITSGMEKLIDSEFPEGDFGIEKIDMVFQTLYNKRREINKILSNQAAVMQSMKVTAKPADDRKSVEEALSSIGEQIAAARNYNQKMNEYNTLVARETQRAQLLNSIRARIEELEKNASDQSEEIIRVLALIDEKRNSSAQMAEIISKTKLLLERVQKTLKELDSNTCPISKKLICTTNKEVVRNDLEKEINDAHNQIKELETKKENTEKELRELTEVKLPTLQTQTNNHKEILALKEKEQNFLAMKIDVPAKPEFVDTEQLIRQDAELRKKLDEINRYDDFMKIKKQHEAGQLLSQDMSRLVDCLSKKGIVKTSIIRGYMETFSSMCNEKASLYGAKVLFVAQDGVHVLMNPDGTGNAYLDLKSLSGGEQAMLLFFLMDMLTNMSGLNILFLDELSVLDKKGMEVLLKLLTDNQETYDAVFLACVDHDDTRELLEKYGVEITCI